MKRKILSLLLALTLAFAVSAVLSACGEETASQECTTHTDANEDKKCDICGAAVESNDPTTDDPTTDDPTTDDPTTDDPTTDDPTTDEPTTDEPTTDEPTTDEPTTDDPTTDDPTTDDPTTDDPTEDSEIVLVKDGVGKISFVVATGLSGEINKNVNALSQKIISLGVESEILFDNTSTLTDVEVLVGAVSSRGEKYIVDGHNYGYNGYTIQKIGNKIVIVGGSEETLIDAIESFEKEILGITKKTKKLTDVTMTTEKNIEVFNDPYPVEKITVAGTDIRDFVIAANAIVSAERLTAESLQMHLYKKTGVWLNIAEPNAENEHFIDINLTSPKTCSSDKGFKLTVKDGNILIDCGFENKIEEAVLGFFMTEITNSKNPEVSFNNGYTYEKVDYRNIYYKDFGAKGDGYTDDFEEILAAHEYANKWGHTVNADTNAKYYIGTEYQKKLVAIPIKTNVNWGSATFTIDDSVVTVQRYDHINEDGNKLCDRCGRSLTDVCSALPGSWHKISLFNVIPENDYVFLADKFNGITLSKDSTNIGWAPEYPVLIKIFNHNIKHFIRFGVNENAGDSQLEIILVDKDGNIDPSTPLHWNYDVISEAYMKRVDDEPITIQGGNFITISNQAANYYDSYARNISITRSNVVFKNIKHSITDEGETRAPYSGFLRVDYVNNITFDNITIQHHVNRYDASSGALLGTYEMGGAYSNDIKFLNIKQSNFFEDDGSVSYKGLFGSNYCKNFYFDGCYMTSMDAHCGLYNGTVKNSTFEHMNFIGEGLILIENVTIYADAAGCAINLRSDYGSTWQGDVIVNGLTMKYSRDDIKQLQLCAATYTDWWFGYTTYLPETIKLDNVKLIKYTQVTDAFGNRTETVVAENAIPFYLFSGGIYGFGDLDISKLVSDGGGAKNNPYIGTKEVWISNCGSLEIPIPKTAQFKDLKYYLEGVEQENW